MGLKLIDPQKWFVLDDFMVSYGFRSKHDKFGVGQTL